MRNGSYSLAFIAALSGLLLLMTAEPNDFQTSLGTLLLIAAPLLVGLGKVIDVLDYVGEGAANPDDQA